MLFFRHEKKDINKFLLLSKWLDGKIKLYDEGIFLSFHKLQIR